MRLAVALILKLCCGVLVLRLPIAKLISRLHPLEFILLSYLHHSYTPSVACHSVCLAQGKQGQLRFVHCTFRSGPFNPTSFKQETLSINQLACKKRPAASLLRNPD